MLDAESLALPLATMVDAIQRVGWHAIRHPPSPIVAGLMSRMILLDTVYIF